MQTFRSLEQEFPLGKFLLGYPQASCIVHRFESFQILSSRPRMANRFRIASPLQLGIRRPGVDAQIILFIRNDCPVFGQSLVELGGAAEILSAVVLSS